MYPYIRIVRILSSDGFGLPSNILSRASEFGHKSIGITDHGNCFSHVPFKIAAEKTDIKPIFGVEFYVTDDCTSRVRGIERLKAKSDPHVTILAMTQKGYGNLLKLNRLAWTDGFYYKPRIDWNLIAQHQEGLLVLSGCVGGYPSRLINHVDPQAAHEFVRERRTQIEHYYIELVPEPGLDISHSSLPWLVQIARDLQVPMVITSDAHFPRPEDYPAQDLLLSVGTRQKVNSVEREIKLPDFQYYCGAEELLERARVCAPNASETELVQAINNTGTLADMCNVEIPKATQFVFRGLPNQNTSEQFLWSLITDGMGQRNVINDEHYAKRVQHEFAVIRNKGFCDYILAIWEVVNWAKSLPSLVMCRGSAGGCLILWLIGASETDPIYHKLSFERFYDDNRPDPPDVDIDFEKRVRNLAVKHVYDIYGANNCSQLANIMELKAKSALQDAAGAYDIPRSVFGDLSNALSEDTLTFDNIRDRAALDVLNKYPQLRIVEKIIGQYRQSSVHACGVIISPDALENHIGVIYDKDKMPIACVDKKGAVEMGFLKMDFLSVEALDVLSLTLRAIDKDTKWLHSLPLNDAESYVTAKSGFMSGVFQLDGASALRVSKEIGLDTFDDLVAASALCRPGPGDWVETYKNNKLSPARFQAYLGSLHPIAADIVKDTFGIVVYQEQIMRFARELAGFEWKDVHKLRKGVSGSAGVEFVEQYRDMFYEGATKNGVREAEIGKWWVSILTHGAYSFNLSHAVTYALISYYMLYLKTHFPAQFYEAYLQLESDPSVVKSVINEFKFMGGQVELLDPRYSKFSFSSPREGVLIGGYSNLFSIGTATANKILEGGPYPDWNEFLKSNNVPLALKKKIEKLGIANGDIDPNEQIVLAPWCPISSMKQCDREARDRNQISGLSILKDCAPWSRLTVAGYVTVVDFGSDHIKFVLEDPDMAILVRIAKKHIPALADRFRNIQAGDFVAVKGAWQGEAFYAESNVIIRKRS